MKNEQLAIQIETYSNAIIGFLVLQALAYSFSFGTNEFFNCTIKTAKYLAHGLTILFCVVTILACFATVALGRTLVKMSPDNYRIVRNIYIGKCIAVIVFTTLPLAITVGYGLMDYPAKYDCKKAKAAIKTCER